MSTANSNIFILCRQDSTNYKGAAHEYVDSKANFWHPYRTGVAPSRPPPGEIERGLGTFPGPRPIPDTRRWVCKEGFTWKRLISQRLRVLQELCTPKTGDSTGGKGISRRQQFPDLCASILQNNMDAFSVKGVLRGVYIVEHQAK